MPLEDLSGVTSSLINLLEANLPELGSPAVTILPQPPEKVGEVMNTLSLHLYHLAEDPHFKNLPGAGVDPPNVAKNPLALCLYYILTTHHETGNPDQDPLAQQKLMGHAVKTFHDFPVITDATHVDGTQVLDPALLGEDNRLQVILRPVTPEDALSFWSTEEQQTARLSAYYEVRVIFLKPEEPKRFPGTVLSVGNFVFQLGAPHLTCSRSLVRFTLPVSAGGAEEEIDVSPARATLDSAGPPAAPNNQVTLLGTHLSGGRSRSLLLRGAVLGDQGFDPVEVDPALNPAWNLDVRSDRITFQVASQLDADDGSGGIASLKLLPGAYTALLRVVQDEKVVQGQLRRIQVSSNEVGFFISPRILSQNLLGDGSIELAIGPEFDVLDPDLPSGAVELVVDGVPYTLGSPPLDPGEFGLASVPAVSNTLTLMPEFSLVGSVIHPVRLIVNGAESPPCWIEP